MLVLAIEQWEPQTVGSLYKHFDEAGPGLPSDVAVLGSWVDASLRRCWQVMDVPDVGVVQRWASYMTVEIVPVLDGVETRSALLGRDTNADSAS